jgi:hypothetical protein
MYIIADTNHEMYYSSRQGQVPILEYMRIFERSFLIFYSVEISMKLWVHRVFFFVGEGTFWNIFDLLLIVFGYVGLALEGSAGAVDTTFLRIMRLIKIVKILRAVRLMRLLEPLRVILSCLINSVLSLVWSLVMMLLFFFMFSTVFVQFSSSYLQTHWEELQLEKDPTLLYDLIRQFGSVQTAMMSLYQASTGGEDWSVFYRSISQTGQINAAIFLFFVAFTQIALLNIITGLFIESALKNAVPNAETRAMSNRREYFEEVELLKRIFKGIDSDSDNALSMAEFDQALTANAKVQHTLEVMGLDTMDAHNLFAMMLEVTEGRASALDVNTFIHSCLRLRGPGSSRDIQKLLFRVKAIDMHLANVSHKVSKVEQLVMPYSADEGMDAGNYVV